MVYLIHFQTKLHQAQHYLGFVAGDLMQRIELHRRNMGSKLLAAINNNGINWQVEQTRCFCPHAQAKFATSVNIHSLLKFKTMLLLGRITADAIVNTLKDERQVVNFSIAINDYYKPKGATEAKKLTTYVNCSYWVSSKIAERVKKGTLVEINGRIFVDVYTDMNGTAKGSLKCHANSIKVHGYGKQIEVIGQAQSITSTEDKKDDLPF
jgi:single-strand DNA-binding protein